MAGMFTSHSLRGRILNRALHHQHARIYNFDRSTMTGTFEQPCTEFTQLFLDFVDHGRRGRIFTYVLTLDGQFRFTETGKEFGIDLLSKHTMHSDVSIYIAFSGEFFVRLRKKHSRRLRQSITSVDSRPSRDSRDSRDEDDGELESDTVDHDTDKEPVGDCTAYELIIDNDSGTYRPNADKLPLLREYMSMNFPGLHITTLDCQKDEERMNRLKDHRRAEKQRARENIVYTQQMGDSASSLSSSDEEEMRDRVGQPNDQQSDKQHNGLSENLHDMKDVRGKLKHWVEAADGDEGHSKETSNGQPTQNGATHGDIPNGTVPATEVEA